MKLSETGEANVSLDRGRSVKIDFKRFGKKGKAYTKEYLWLSRAGAFTLNDLKTIVKEAESLMRFTDGEDIAKL